MCHASVGAAQLALQQPEGILVSLSQALRHEEEHVPQSSEQLTAAKMMLARAHLAAEQPKAASTLLQDCSRHLERKHTDFKADMRSAECQHLLAEGLLNRDRHHAALGHAWSAVSAFKDALSQTDMRIVASECCAGCALHGMGRFAEAAQHHERALAICEQQQPGDEVQAAHCHFALARALWQLAQRVSASQHYAAAEGVYRRVLQADDGRYGECKKRAHGQAH